MADINEIESLLYLLEDPDPEVQIGVQNRFMELGENAVPLLDQFRSSAENISERDTINDIIHSITFDTLYEDFSELLDQGLSSRKSLEKAVLMLTRFGNPTLRTEEYRRKLDKFSEQAHSDVVYQLSDPKKMHTLLQFVFRDLRFSGDQKDYHNPDNAFLDKVIDRRKGLPISLSLIVIFLSRRLDLPFYGVNMPIHFMLVYEGEKENILIDPFDGGTVVTYDQCHHFLKKNGVKPRPAHFERAGEAEILHRVIRNLMHSYSKSGKESRVRELQELLHLAELKG